MPQLKASPGGSGRPGPSAVDATPATVTQLVDRLFTRFDGSRDAALTQAEVLAVLDTKGTRTELVTRLATVR